MTTKGKLVMLTLCSWIPILLLIHLPNNIWGIPIKIISGIFLLSLTYNFILGPGSQLISSTGPGIFLNCIFFTIINFNIPSWVRIIILGLIFLNLWTCYKMMKNHEVRENTINNQIENR